MTRQIDAARDRVVLLEALLEESHGRDVFASDDASGRTRTVRQRDAAVSRVTSAFVDPTITADCERGLPNPMIL